MEQEKENEVVQTEEPVKTPTLNKNGKPRKELTEEAKIKLAKAREKANAIRAQNSAKKLQCPNNLIKFSILLPKYVSFSV